MKFSTIIFSLLSAAPLMVQGIAVPKEKLPTVRAVELTSEDHSPVARADDGQVVRADDDEWLMVVWSKSEGDSQCGGTYKKENGVGNACVSFVNSVARCVDMTVRTGVCDFKLKEDGSDCSGSTTKTVTVEAGKDSNGVAVDSDVKFVSVECS